MEFAVGIKAIGDKERFLTMSEEFRSGEKKAKNSMWQEERSGGGIKEVGYV